MLSVRAKSVISGLYIGVIMLCAGVIARTIDLKAEGGWYWYAMTASTILGHLMMCWILAVWTARTPASNSKDADRER